MIKILARLLLLLIITQNLLASGSIDVRAYTDKDDYFIGDYIKYTVEITRDADVQVFMPPVEDSVTVLDFIKQEPLITDDSGNRLVDYYTYIFSKYDSTEIEISPLPIKYKTAGNDETETILTNEVLLVVRTLDIDMQKEIRDVKAPVRIAFDYLFWLLVIVPLIIIAVILYIIWKKYLRRRKDNSPEKIKVKIPPHKIAIKELMQLEEKKLWQQGLVKEFHTEITNIIRSYFEKRFDGFTAMEMTSGEIIEKLKTLDEIQPAFDSTRSFFENADMVKFAKFEPMPTVNEEMMKQGYEIVKLTVPEEKPETSENQEVKDVG